MRKKFENYCWHIW